MVERISIQGTRSSPEVDCDPATKTLRLEGESYPENTFDFYKPLVAWLEDVLAENDGGSDPVTLDVALAYLNTGSIKSLMDMLDRMDEAHEAGTAVAVVWRCDAENERVVELAEELLEDLSLPYEIKTE
ncbi:DUF1987 domain-containing protein [Pacificispira spongiicola]|uniref:DUF1987 domain-containing protein n=1 Tax=Pacificispira spongiicola TaxID=2729598 RepID=UPI001D0CB5E7|nr:DUF1987 domain-containing protein [Pacificispira spongiicola]